MISLEGSLVSRALTLARLVPGAVRELRSKAYWQRALPREVLATWGGDPASLEVVAAMKNVVCAFRAGGRELVLKLVDAKRRGITAIEDEARFVEYLASNGVPVCRPVRSLRGAYAERVDLGRRGTFTAFVVEKAPGNPIHAGEVEHWPPALVERWGAIVGRIHALAKGYDVPQRGKHLGVAERLDFARRKLGRKHPDVLAAIAALTQTLGSLPRDADAFGMVHGDMTSANVFRFGDELTLFDFEASFPAWFVLDVASPLYAALVFGGAFRTDAGIAAAARFFRSFMTGYVRENVLPRWLVALVRDFVALLMLFTVVMMYDQGLKSRAQPFMKTVDALTRHEGALARIGFARIYDEVLASSLRGAAQDPAQPDCCAREIFEQIEELGHVESVDWDLGRCASCGSYLLRQWSEHAPSDVLCDKLTAEEGEALEGARGAARVAFLEQWHAERGPLSRVPGSATSPTPRPH